ncbi:hypothetical protein MPLA_160126 [Mesorhizobium sp. ORS 3359]|nr:hypothetical protein MPLA_160126 [Mesorhizobium sp. ORS 3359]
MEKRGGTAHFQFLDSCRNRSLCPVLAKPAAGPETHHVYEDTLTDANGAPTAPNPSRERETVRVWCRPGAGT